MATARSTNGFVLAGGRSRRMGRDKALLPWGRGTLLDHMVALLSTAVERVYVAGREDLPDRIPGKGPLGGILTALESSDTEDNLIVAVDMPRLTPQFVRAFAGRFSNSLHPLMACRVDGSFPLFLGMRRSILPDTRRRIESGQLSVQDLITNSKVEILDAGFLEGLKLDPSIFANLNTPSDLSLLEQAGDVTRRSKNRTSIL